MMVQEPDLVVFDGHCVFCNGFARLIHAKDPKMRFRFATAQSPAGRMVYLGAGVSPDALETMLVRLDGKVLQKSAAVFAVLRALGGVWWFLSLARFTPRPIRDWFYDRFAGNRYRLFGRHETCPLPSADLRARFVDQGLT